MIWEKHGADKDQVVIATLSTPYLAHFWYPCKDGVADKADSVAVDITVKGYDYKRPACYGCI